MMKRRVKARRWALAAALSGAVVAAALALVPAAIEGTNNNTNGLFAYVVATNRGPLRACYEDGSGCGPANLVWHFIHVANTNKLTNLEGQTNRATVPNAFAVSSVDERVFVNGVEVPESAFTWTPPPNASPLSWSGHWPSTVTCQGEPGSFHTPCDVVGSPAVVPGENTAVLFTGWGHDSVDPNGTYVFRYTVHGTLNGTPVNLTASSPPIFMTS
jgi:hypothetical protein